MATASPVPDIEKTLVARLHALAYDDIPSELLGRSKLFMIDSLGVTIGASRAPGVQDMHRAVRAWETNGSATLLLSGERVSPPSAALANGTAAHALDFDDQHDPARMHTFCAVLPAALAAAEARGNVSGREFLAAVIIGAELACRLGLSCQKSLDVGCHPTTALGTLAAAAAAARILHLSEAQTLHALAIGFVQLSGTTQSIADGALTKRMGAGLAARNGVLAAHLAQHHLTGPHRFLDGEAGLFRFHQRDLVDRELLLEGLGEKWELASLSIKPFPCCRASHATIQLGIELHSEGVQPDDIREIEIRLGHVNWLMVGAPFDPPSHDPVVHAQFNATYGFARALLDGSVGLNTFDVDQIRSVDRRLCDRTRCVVALEIASDSVASVAVVLNMKDGRVVRRQVDAIKGSPASPMTEAELLQKFRNCVAFGLEGRPDEGNALVEAVSRLERMNDIAELVSAFPRRAR